jgi:hypothetical protein
MAAVNIGSVFTNNERASDLVVPLCGGGYAHIPTVPERKNRENPIGPCHGGIADLRKRLNTGSTMA